MSDNTQKQVVDAQPDNVANSVKTSKNKIFVHALGGAGIKSCCDIFNGIADNHDAGFPQIVFNYIDTTRVNIDAIQPRGDFRLIKTKTSAKTGISGAGAERAMHAADIHANIKEYVDEHDWLRAMPGEYHVVIFSCSGGTGSAAGPYLIMELLKHKIPTIAIMFGDTSNGQYCKNTKRTIASLNNIAQKANESLASFYINNQTYTGSVSPEKEANKVMMNLATSLSVFLTGTNADIDNTDMLGIIMQSHYKTVNVPAGLYGLAIYAKEIELPPEAVATTGRTLTLEGVSPEPGINFLHHKVGYVENPKLIEMLGKDQFPIHMVAYANFFVSESKKIDEKIKQYEDIEANIRITNISGDSKAAESDDGMVF